MNRGVTLRLLAEATGVSKATLIRLERGGEPHATTAKRIADFFGVQVTDIWPVEEEVAA